MGYYNLKDHEDKMVKLSGKTAFMCDEEEAQALSVGDLFTSVNGQWYVVVGNRDYRPWFWC